MAATLARVRVRVRVRARARARARVRHLLGAVACATAWSSAALRAVASLGRSLATTHAAAASKLLHEMHISLQLVEGLHGQVTRTFRP